MRVHPETGEWVRFVSRSFLKPIAVLTPQEILHVMEMLREHIERPEVTVHFSRDAGCVAVRDNCATAHLAPCDVYDSDLDRQYYRVTSMGGLPVGAGGRASIPIEGTPIRASAAAEAATGAR